MKPEPDISAADGDELKHIGMFEILVLFLSVYTLGAMVLQALLTLPPEVHDLLDRFDFAVCMVFLLDFAIRFRRAESKLRFMRWGWVDLLSSIPQLDPLRWGRLARIFRVIRVLRVLGSTRRIVAFLYRRRNRSLAGTAILVTVLLMMFSCISILSFEDEETSNIKTPQDAIWWAFTTITTVGYGDKFPVTLEGRVVATVLMVAGISLFGIFTGLFARHFMEPDVQREDKDIKLLTDEIRLLREKLERMELERRDSGPPAAAGGD